MAEYGPLTRHVADAGRLMDVIKDGGPSLRAAAATEPGPLRVAVSAALPIPGLHPDGEQKLALERATTALRDLGHKVETRELDYGLTMGNRVLARFVKGVGDKAVELGHRDRLSRRARGIARIGTSIPSRVTDAAAERAGADAARLNAIFEHADVALTPMFTRRPPRVREFDGRPGWLTLIGMTRFAPYNGTFNHTGHPAVAVPAGLTADGFPLSVQFVGPPDAEARLVSLSAQLERAIGWPAQRPAVAA
jgi:amidase